MTESELSAALRRWHRAQAVYREVLQRQQETYESMRDAEKELIRLIEQDDE